MKTKRFLIGLLVAIFAILGNPKERLFAQDGVKITDTTNVNSSSEDLSILEMINASNDVNGTNEETDRIIKEKINTKIEKGFVDSILPLANLLVPITGIVIPFLFAFLVSVFYFNHQKESQNSRNELLIKAMETGQQLPKEIFENEKTKKYDLSLRSLKRGLITTGVGLGMMIWGVIEDVDLIGIGAIVFFIGVAQLLFIFLGKKYFVNNADSINNSQNKENEISE